ncbi:UDP-glucose 4-epimerase GalE [Parahaliea maris]|uniref:UDP-glucose 4-epimerase n=1 Tax=Parahaliea maris TaxID=2716870 RepID=A0A5C8ZSS5_9GAMM|nr:UDP-glucose 4-epimerase GalE [Parahaliea maris]TXS90834.1 UDP-glucose 4-epimerase GalE [Parahaliea maris]
MPNTILVTGGAGYIGSHTVVALIEAGYQPLVLDNFCNSSVEVFQRIEEITGYSVPYIEGDVCDRGDLDAVFHEYDIKAAIHFAGLKAVGESVAEPLRYYRTNVFGSLNLLEAMAAAGVQRFVFSSSATVYGDPDSNPIQEHFPRRAMNPYGQTKLAVEKMLEDLSASDPAWRLACLRYFNPVGAHPSGLIGEDPQGIPNNLMPFIAQVAVGRREYLSVFGGDYPTRDGTGVRDYIHVMDLAEGHVAALKHLEGQAGLLTANLGTGEGVSVLEMLSAFEEACGKRLAHEIVARRPGDVPEYYGDPSLAEAVLGWRATRGVAQMCEDVWRWQSGNPEGYR